MTDTELLEEFRRGSHRAFATLVERHINWVYSVARRIMRDGHLAEDVTQTVFAVLAQKCPRLGNTKSVSTWLFSVVTLSARQAMRTELRRRRHETEAAKMQSLSDAFTPSFDNELPVEIDGLIGRLNTADQQVLLLRFYEQKSFAEIGSLIGIGEDAARKRTSRAVEKLRANMPRGKAISVTALGAILAANICHPAPAALAASVSSASVMAGVGAANPIGLALAWANLKGMVVAIATVAIITASGVAVALQASSWSGSGTTRPLKTATARVKPAPIFATTAPSTQPWVNEAIQRAWYALEQTNTAPVLHGLTARLSRRDSSTTSPATTRNAIGGAQLELDVQLAPGDAIDQSIAVGFFTDAKWSADPVLVRNLTGKGKHLLTGVPAGAFSIAAMAGTGAAPSGLGVDDRWPKPVQILDNQNNVAAVRLSALTALTAEQPRGLGQYSGLGSATTKDADRLITVRVVDSAGGPIPFAIVTLASRKGAGAISTNEYGLFYQLHTDVNGVAYTTQISDEYTFVEASAWESEPETFTMRAWGIRRAIQFLNIKQHPELVVKFPPHAKGNAKVAGRVHDQFDQPVREFRASINTADTRLPDWDQSSIATTVINRDGRFELDGVMPGNHTVRIFPFDSCYTPVNPQPLIIPNDPQAQVWIDLAVEAKELYYGKALYEDQSPIRGSWILRYAESANPPGRRGGKGGSLIRMVSGDIQPDGTFRVELTAAQRKDIAKYNGTILLRQVTQKGEFDIGQTSFSVLSKDPSQAPNLLYPRVTK